ncbi:MAG: DUF3047 domain-containing protein, partial [Caldimonas sp.]
MDDRPILGPRTLARLAALLAATVLAGAALAEGAAITAFSAASPGEAPPPWKFATLPNKTATKFSIVEFDGARVLKVQADDSYGNLIHPVRMQPTASTSLAWRWRVDKLVDDADIKIRSGDDSPAKLCVFFDFDSGKLPFGERAKLAVAGSTTGQDVPTETLCYVWDNKLAPETSLVNAFTKRVRFIVLQSGAGKLGQWVTQRRDVAADYQKAFGDESQGKLPA